VLILVGWVHINQDALGTAVECKKALEKAIKHGRNVVLGMYLSVQMLIEMGYLSIECA